jgi:hypothetical protein
LSDPCRRLICPILDTPSVISTGQIWIWARTIGRRGSSPNVLAGDHGGPSRDWLETESHATDQSVTTDSPGSNARLVGSREFRERNHGTSFTSNENYHPTLDLLFVGCRVCVRRKPRTCIEVVRVMPMTGRVVVRLDPPHPTRHGTLRSLRPERLVIYS